MSVELKNSVFHFSSTRITTLLQSQLFSLLPPSHTTGMMAFPCTSTVAKGLIVYTWWKHRELVYSHALFLFTSRLPSSHWQGNSMNSWRVENNPLRFLEIKALAAPKVSYFQSSAIFADNAAVSRVCKMLSKGWRRKLSAAWRYACAVWKQLRAITLSEFIGKGNPGTWSPSQMSYNGICLCHLIPSICTA